MSLTDAQRRAVDARGGVAVTAGAGTGKTHTLGHRYLRHLERGLSPLEVLAVTFTERAAFELRARVRRYLREHPEPPGGTRTVVELEAAQISTLHALAARICRDHPEAAGVPADFVVLGELEGRAWFREQLERALTRLPRELLVRVPFPTVAQTMERLLEDPVTAERALAHEGDAWREAVERARGEAVAELTGSEAWREAAGTVRSLRGADGDKLEDARRFGEAALDAMEAGRAEEAEQAMAKVDLRGGRKDAWPPGARERIREALVQARQLLSDAMKEGLVALSYGDADRRWEEALPHLRDAFARVRGALDEAKRRERVLDFGDLEAHALRALERPEVRAHYAARWRALLVDEFQDTNPVQEALLERLAREAVLTVVGDEKQGIYGFRGADVSVFRRVRGDIESGGGAAVTLSTSFRTHAALVERVNAVAAPLLGPLHQDLRAVRQRAPHGGPHLEAAAVDRVPGVTKPARQVAEARWIAERIRTLCDAGILVEGSDGPRPIRFGDVAVLARSWRPLDRYAELLPAFGVPAVHTGGGDLLATREAQDATALLRFLADPADDLALVAVLRSPFFAVDDRTLQRAAARLPKPERRAGEAHRGWWSWLQAWDGDAEAPPPVDERPAAAGPAVRGRPTNALLRARDVLRELLAWRDSTPPSRLLFEADAATGYRAVLANLPSAGRREADWRGFTDLVRELERGHEDVFGVVRRLRRIRRAGVEAPRPALEAGDAVTLTTIHRSKGLEWPVVVLADLDAGGGGPSPGVRVDADVGVAAEPRGEAPGETVRPALLTLLDARVRRAEEAEGARVLYVALTRARDRLLLTATEPGKGALLRLEPGLAAAGVTVEAIGCSAEAVRWPTPPATPQPSTDADEPWLRDTSTLGIERRHVAGTAGAAAAPGPSSPWATARAHVEEREPSWLPLLDALREAEVPAPDAFDVELTRAGRESGTVAPLAWLKLGPVALVGQGTELEGHRPSAVEVDAAEPLAALDALLAVLGPVRTAPAERR